MFKQAGHTVVKFLGMSYISINSVVHDVNYYGIGLINKNLGNFTEYCIWQYSDGIAYNAVNCQH